MKKIIGFLFSDKSEKTSAKSKRTIAVILVAFLFALFILVGRVAWIQFAKGKTYKEAAFRQQNSGRELTPVRGTIYDTNGNVLATSLSAVKVAVNPKYFNSLAEAGKINLYEYRDMISTKLSGELGIPYEEVMKTLEKNTSYALVASKVDTEIGEKIKKWAKENKLNGIYVDDSFVRYYPNGSLASHILGFTGSDDQGLVCGIEVALDSYLAGTPGKVLADVDTSGNELPYDIIRRIDPENGYNAVLTIDSNIQLIVENHLHAAIERYGVLEGACCIVMDPYNADVLAMASYPYFDPNMPYAYPKTANLAITEDEWPGNTTEGVGYLSSTVWRNKALTDTYEPGSTFKALVTTMVLEDGAAQKDTPVSDRELKLAGWTIRCWQDNDDTPEDESHGEETFEEGVINSCNPVFAKMALELGIDKFYSYVDAFGFYNKTGIMLSGEANSIMHKNPTEIDLAVAGFGQRFQITPIQIATAYCALANGGTLYTPRIVKYLTDEDGNIAKSFEPEAVRQVISENVCRETLDILKKVVSDGTGSNAYVPGYRIAGKTGTSETTQTLTTGRYVVSFAGIAPAEKPEIVVLVVLDHPTEGSIGGGALAAPLAGDIIEEILEYRGVEKKYTEEDLDKLTFAYYVPDYTDITVKEASLRINKTFTYKVIGENTSDDQIVVAQYPPEHTALSRGSVIYLYTSDNVEHVKTVVPDVNGMDIKDAFDTLNAAGLNMFAEHIGSVYWQSEEAGKEVEAGTCLMLAIENKNMETADDIAVTEELRPEN